MRDGDAFARARIRIVRLPGWQVGLIAAVAVALVLTLALVAVGAFLVILPIVLVAGLLWRFLARTGWFGRRRRTARGPTTIEGDYVVVQPEALERRDHPRQ
ncbi:hypothetical protein QNA08_14080 [Chelatococcus sp. SYSU_G07232]|uniref:Uncharacterized protein n=1 Tax=Chelatococcus albus TaxID=3047466 RepID=A0ABT7AJ02_9HYPH|nr:hypothetical protein [Chelatococcus sp. SYSU_G07232]MDJ1159363.1 hypothetical protein [Chelatococcus sp. SYSU_G07232]